MAQHSTRDGPRLETKVVRKRTLKLQQFVQAALSLLALALAVPVHADDAPPPPIAVPTTPDPGSAQSPADALSDQGKALYKEQKFAEAFAVFQRGHGVEPRPGFLYNMAKCKEKLADYAEAVKLLEAYLALHRQQNAGAEPANAADTVALIRELKRRAFEALPEVSVQSSPAGAQVLENGVTLGTTPLVTHMQPGPHKIVLKLDRHSDLEAEVQVPQSGKVAVVLSLKSTVKRAAVAFGCNVRGAQIALDGKVVAMSPFDGQIEVEPGKHQVAMSRAGYRSVETVIDVPEDKLSKVHMSLDLIANPTTFRTVLGWPMLVLGALAAGGGGVASYYADQEWRGTQNFNDLVKLQNLGYYSGGATAGLGLLLLIWDGARDGIPDEERVVGARKQTGVDVSPLPATAQRP